MSTSSSSRIVIVILIPPGGVHGSSTASWRTQGQLRPWLIGQCILRTQEYEMACAARHVCVRVRICGLSQRRPFVRLQLQLLLLVMLLVLQVLVLRLVRIVRAMRFSLAHSQIGRIGRGLGSSLAHGSGGSCHVTATATGCAGSTTAATNATATAAAASSKRHILFALAFGCIQDHHDKGSKFRPRSVSVPNYSSWPTLYTPTHTHNSHSHPIRHARCPTNKHTPYTSSSSDLPQFKTCRGCPTSQAPGAAVVPVNTQCICNAQYSRHSEWYNRGILQQGPQCSQYD